MPRSVKRRRFPPPWTIEENNNARFIVRDSTGQALGYFYFEEEPGRRSRRQAAHPQRGPPHGGELRQAAGTAAPRGLVPTAENYQCARTTGERVMANRSRLGLINAE